MKVSFLTQAESIRQLFSHFLETGCKIFLHEKGFLKKFCTTEERIKKVFYSLLGISILNIYFDCKLVAFDQ